MPDYDLIIHNAAIVSEPGLRIVSLGITDGKIAAGRGILPGTARETIDATRLSLFAGVIDPHVHFDEPGRADWEGFASGSRAFAVGGGTTYFDMPLNAHPPTIDGPSFDRKLAAALASSVTDFALWGGIVPGNLDHLEELAARGVIGFKAFMSRTGTDDFPAADDLTLYEGMARAAALGRVVAVHAESDALTAGLARRAVAAGRVGMRDYLASRPVVAEVEAIGRALAFAETTGCALHIVHVSSGRGVALVAEARARGLDVSCETCPHYLIFTDEDAARIGAAAKCAPPLRPQAEQDALWAHLAAGTLPIVASDHSPAPPAMKAGDDYFAIWGGIAGCQSTLPAMLTAADERGLPPTALANLLAGNAARRFGLPQKGSLQTGADADFALVAPEDETTLRAADLRYRHPISPYVGRRFRGRVVRTILRGRTIMRDGEIIGEPRGQFVRPETNLVAGDMEGRGTDASPRSA